jgi:hypothetical protein
MPKKPSDVFGAQQPIRDNSGKVQYGSDGKPLTQWRPMQDGWFLDRDGHQITQSLYFDDGRFKGMAQILVERGHNPKAMACKRFECNKFKCPPVSDGCRSTCCCWRMLYTEPDFVGAKFLIKEICCNRGFGVLFLPKFHCELNPIEQCWGHAKQRYRDLPASSSVEVLQKNVLAVMATVPLEVIRRCLFYLSLFISLSLHVQPDFVSNL